MKARRSTIVKWRSSRKILSFVRGLRNPLFERIARAVIGGDIAIYRALLFNKAKQGGTVLPFHQDGGSYWGLDRDPTLQIWTALDDVPVESGCVEIVPKSHEGGLATPLGGVVPRRTSFAPERPPRTSYRCRPEPVNPYSFTTMLGIARA